MEAAVKKKKVKRAPKLTSSVRLSKQISQKDLTKIRSGLREAFIRSTYKAEYLDKFKQLIPRYTKANKLHKTPWVKYQCECCEELFKSDEINVDHIENVGAFKSIDDIEDFFFRIWCSYDNLQVLCVQCHDDKTTEERKSAALAKKKVKDLPVDNFVKAYRDIIDNGVDVMSQIDTQKVEEKFVELVTSETAMDQRVESLGVSFLGFPLKSDSFLSEGEMCFEVKNHALHLVTFRDDVGNGSTEAYCQSKLNKFIKGGAVVTGVRCHSINDLGISLETRVPLSYSVETAEAKPLDLSSLI